MKFGDFMKTHVHGWQWVNNEARLILYPTYDDLGVFVKLISELGTSEGAPIKVDIGKLDGKVCPVIDLTANFSGIYWYDEVTDEEPIGKKRNWLWD